MRDATPDRREEAIRFFTGLPLADLRRWQSLNKSTTAYGQLQDAVDPAERARLERGLSNAQIDAEMLSRICIPNACMWPLTVPPLAARDHAVVQ